MLSGIVLLFAVVLAIDVQASVDNPSMIGPYKVGSANFTYPLMGEVEPVNAKFYYPATSDGLNETPDTSGAPYSTVFWFDNPGMDPTAEDYLRYHVVSHGVVFVNNRRGAHLKYPSIKDDAAKFDYAWASMIDAIEDLNGDPTSPLYGMVDPNAYAMSGWMDGYYGAIAAANDGRTEAYALLSPTPGTDEIGYLFWDEPTHIQQAEYNYEYQIYLDLAYPNLKSEVKSEFTIRGADLFEGGYDLGLYLTFLFYHLEGKEEYRTILYGEVAIQGFIDEEYDLRYSLSDNDFFPPDPYIMELTGPVFMETDVGLDLEFVGYPDLYNHSELTVEWVLEVYGTLASSEGGSVNASFPAPGEWKLTAEWWIVDRHGWSFPFVVSVVNKPPVADAGPNISVNMDDEVVFEGNASRDTPSHDDRLEYKWFFPKGDVTDYSNQSTATWTFTEVGRFEVVLTVRDPEGSESSSICNITVDNVAPTVTMDTEPPTLEEDEAFSFTCIGLDTPSHSGSLEFKWAFENGSETDWASSPETTYAFKRRGTYVAIVWVKDPLDETVSITFHVTVENIDPVCSIDRPKDGADGVTDSSMRFTGWGTDTPSDNGTLWYTWDFGDGMTANGQDVDHIYEKAGTYTVTLTVEDDDGATAVVTHTITIEAAPLLDGPIAVTLTVGLVFILVMGFAVTSEPTKYWFGLLGAPLFTRTKDILDNKTRLALHGNIVENPGIHYSALRGEFNLANGQAAYHLNVLEQESFIRSVRDGKLKRFYSAHSKVPKDVGKSTDEIRDEIVELIRGSPVINQLEVMEELGLDRANASYYLRELVKEGRLKAEKDGRFTIYSVKGRK
jgi:predicted transcriptional regulator